LLLIDDGTRDNSVFTISDIENALGALKKMAKQPILMALYVSI